MGLASKSLKIVLQKTIELLVVYETKIVLSLLELNKIHRREVHSAEKKDKTIGAGKIYTIYNQIKQLNN